MKSVTKYWYILLAVVFLAAVPVALYSGLPEILEIPKDFSLTMQVDSFDNFYDQERATYGGEQQSKTTFSLTTVAGDSDELVIKGFFDVRSLSGQKIFSVSRLYGVDAHSGKHISAYGDRKRSGYLFGPRMRGFNVEEQDKASFEYWHINYDVPARMEYRDTQLISGLETYHYESNFTADQTKDLAGALPGVGTDKGISLDVHLELWIEPYSGRIVKYADNAEAFYYSLADQERLRPWNKFHNNTSALSAADLAKSIAILKARIIVFELGVPVILLLLAILSMLYPQVRRLFAGGEQAEGGWRNSRLLPFAAGSILMIATIGLVLIFYELVGQQTRADFNADTVRITNAIERGLQVKTDLLRGTQGLFNASRSVERDEWEKYARSLDLSTNYPAILGLGFGKVVTAKEKAAVIDEVRRDGFPDFSIRPAGDRGSYVLVYYIEPFVDVNKNALGFDMASEAVRAAAISYARDSGTMALTGKIFLVQDTASGAPQPAFIIYAPIYKANESHATTVERQRAIFGYVYAAIRVENFMSAILVNNESDLGIEIYDGGQQENLSKERLMYSNTSARVDAELSQLATVNFYNRQWTIRYTAPSSFFSDVIRNSIPIAILVLGLIMSILVTIMLYTLNTRRAKAVELAREMTHSLEFEKARAEAILSSVGDGLVATDKAGVIILVNRAFEQILGLTLNEVKGKKLIDVVPLLTSDQKPINPDERLITRAIVEKKVVSTSAIDDKYYKRENGSVFPVGIVVSPILIAEELIGAVEVFRDISQEKEIDKAKSEFVSLASHQLRTPLSAVNWYAEMLLSGDAGPINENQKKFLDEIYAGNQRMVELVNSLLNVSRLELGTFVLEPSAVDIAKLTESVVNEQRQLIIAKKQHFSQFLEENLPVLNADPKLLRIVLQNLLSNAIKYTPDGGSVSLAINRLDRNQLLIKVSDTGCGITKGQQGKIFTKMFRADNVRAMDTEGNGLGLYIVKAIIEKSGGSIRFESEEGKGTTFFVTLPISH